MSIKINKNTLNHFEKKGRCSCGSSFSFEEKKLKIDLEKLKNLKLNFTSGK